MNKAKNPFPLPLIIIFLVILFFVGLILSALYFQSKLNQLNTASQETHYNSKFNKSLIIGFESENKYNYYFIDLSSLLAKELAVGIEVKKFSSGDIFKALDEQQIDLIISPNALAKDNMQKYNISKTYINLDKFDFQLISRKEDINLLKKVDYALNGLIIKGTILDLKQKWLD